MPGLDDEPRFWARLDRSIAAPPQRALARQMRAKPTDAERMLWHFRRRLKIPDTHFRRQVQIGRYIGDFVCHSARLVIEVDGGQHATRTEADMERTKVLEGTGYRVLRFWNNDMLTNIDGVLEEIQRAITTTPLTPPHKGEGNRKANHARPVA